MSDVATFNEDEASRLVVAIIDFLREQLINRTDLVPEDRDCLEIAVQCLEMAYGLDSSGYVQFRFARPLLDIFSQVANPVSVRDKLSAEAHKDEGNSLMGRSMFQNAESEYSNAIELDRWNAIYYCNRASSRIEQQNFFQAIADCRQALLLNPDYAKAHGRMGQAYALLQRHREAANCFRQALELEPGNERYRNNLRVAENQINRNGADELITRLINSIFGMVPRSDTNDPNVTLPSSFMIITESEPSRMNASQRNSRSTAIADKITQETAITETADQRNPNVHHSVAGVVNERPFLQIDIPENTTTDNDSQEFIIQLNGCAIFQEVDPPIFRCEQCTQTEDGEKEQVIQQNTDKLEERDKIAPDLTSSVIPISNNANSEDGNEAPYQGGDKDNMTTDISQSDVAEKVKQIIDSGKESVAKQNLSDEASGRSTEKLKVEDNTVCDKIPSEISTRETDSEIGFTETTHQSKKSPETFLSVQAEKLCETSREAKDDVQIQDEFKENEKSDDLATKLPTGEEKIDAVVPSQAPQNAVPFINFPSKEENVVDTASGSAKNSVTNTINGNMAIEEDEAENINNQKKSQDTANKPETNQGLKVERKDTDTSVRDINSENKDLPVQENKLAITDKNDGKQFGTKVYSKTKENEHELSLQLKNPLSTNQANVENKDLEEKTNLDKNGKQEPTGI